LAELMQISKREKTILAVAVALGLVFVLSGILPSVRGLYTERQNVIADIELQIERERRLFEESAQWRSRRIETETNMQGLETRMFNGDTVPIIEANIQRSLTQYARDSGINVNSTRLAERLETDDWIMVQQEMSFQTQDAANTIEFLRLLGESSPRLWITDFSLNRNRNQFAGSIIAVGFARKEGVLMSSAGTR